MGASHRAGVLGGVADGTYPVGERGNFIDTQVCPPSRVEVSAGDIGKSDDSATVQIAAVGQLIGPLFDPAGSASTTRHVVPPSLDAITRERSFPRT